MNEKGNCVKCQCIVYCQKGSAKSISNSEFTEQLLDRVCSIDTFYYLMLFLLLSVFIFGHKVCDRFEMNGPELVLSSERKAALAAGEDSLTLME